MRNKLVFGFVDFEPARGRDCFSFALSFHHFARRVSALMSGLAQTSSKNTPLSPPVECSPELSLGLLQAPSLPPPPPGLDGVSSLGEGGGHSSMYSILFAVYCSFPANFAGSFTS